MVQDRIEGIQFLRAAAALLVVYFHSANQVAAYDQYLPNIGEQGVDLFFVISGFIMVLVTRREVTPGRFLLDRVSRVVPLYWFFTLLLAAALLIAPALFKNAVFDLPVLLKSLFFLPATHPVFSDQIWPLLIPGWSLNYEFYFYLLFAVGLLLPQKLIWLWMGFALSGFYLVANLLPYSAIWARFVGDSVVFEFLLGMGIAWLYLRGIRTDARLALLLFAVSLGLFLIPNELPRLIGWGVPAAGLFWALLNLSVPKSRLLSYLGDCSYSLYLSHLFVLGACAKLLPPLLGEGAWAAVAFTLLSLSAAQLVAILVHMLVDRMLLRPGRWHLVLAYLPALVPAAGAKGSKAKPSIRVDAPTSSLPPQKAHLHNSSRS